MHHALYGDIEGRSGRPLRHYRVGILPQTFVGNIDRIDFGRIKTAAEAQ
jgi:hypothetical protein